MNENALSIATVFGPFLAVLGIWMLVYTDNVMKTYASIKGTPAVMYLRSVTNILLGLFVISLFNVWMMDAVLIVTLLGWGMLVRGVVGLFAPQVAIRIGMSDQKILQIRGIIPLVWGLLLLWIAFWR